MREGLPFSVLIFDTSISHVTEGYHSLEFATATIVLHKVFYTNGLYTLSTDDSSAFV